MSEQEIARAVALRREGMSARQIAAEMYYGKSTIDRVIRHAAPELAAQRRQDLAAQRCRRWKEAVRLYSEGQSAREIARQVGYAHRRGVYWALAKARKEEIDG